MRKSEEKVKKITVYLCPNCGCKHYSYDSAQECCPPSVDEEDRFICTECDTEYEDETKAQQCCTPIEASVLRMEEARNHPQQKRLLE
jgi:hypothetical protein